MSKRQPNPWLMPSVTGWVFADPSGATVRGTNLATLIAAVETYRSRNGLSAGTPDEEVSDYLCDHNPLYCSGGTVSIPARPLGDRIMQWVAAIVRMPSQLASLASSTVADRVRACVACPHNAQRYGASCGSCGKNTLLLEEKLGVNNPNLRHCNVFAFSNALAVRVSAIPADSAAPENCWRHPSNFKSLVQAPSEPPVSP